MDAEATATALGVRHMRAEMGLDQAQLAKLVGVHKKTPSRWETGRVRIPQGTFLLLKNISQNYALVTAVKNA